MQTQAQSFNQANTKTSVLTLQVANLYGKGADKLSFDGRVEFARNHMNEVFDAADNPFGGSRCARNLLPYCNNSYLGALQPLTDALQPLTDTP